jgi:hypothetical protein
VQYEVKLQKGLDCGGAYIKLLTEDESGSGLRAGDEYTDKVGSAHGTSIQGKHRRCRR